MLLWIYVKKKASMYLSEIATISSGYLFRCKVLHKESGEYYVIQMKDIDEYNNLDVSRIERVDIQNVKDVHIVNQGDILFKSRGQQHLATVIDRQMDNAIAVSQFFIIRIIRKDILPEYLAWYLNQKPAQQYFVRIAAGGLTAHINMKNLEQLEVVIPPIEIGRAHV